MLDIIIPTLMRCPIECLKYSIEEAISNKFVENIFIIDNTGQQFKQNINLVSKKLYIFEMSENLYVNPSWNFGVSLSKSENILIMNDDLYVNSTIYNYVDQIMQDQDVGLCSVETYVLKSLDRYLSTIDSFNNILTFNETFGFEPKKHNISGWFFCMKRKLWKNIPENIKILYGDILIYNRIRRLNYQTKNITNVKIGHINHATGKMSNIVKRDTRNYNLLKDQYILEQ